MPRVPIKDHDTSFFHLMVQGIRREYIFSNTEDKKLYLTLMKKYLKKFEVKIIAYCIMDNHAHMLVYIENKKELSEYMRAINTTYALYYNRKYKKAGYVFRNRYKVEAIYSEKYLINCIHYIHDNPTKAKICKEMEKYKYSSYYEYINNGEIIKISNRRFKNINNLYIEEIDKPKEIDYSYMDYEENKEFLNKAEVIKEYETENGMNKHEIKLNKNHLKEIAKKLKEECGMTHREIADEFEVSRVKITRLLNLK